MLCYTIFLHFFISFCNRKRFNFIADIIESIVLKDIFTGGFPGMMHFRSFIHINQFYQSIPRGISQTIHYIAFFFK
jgi:hypothetical protein